MTEMVNFTLYAFYCIEKFFMGELSFKLRAATMKDKVSKNLIERAKIFAFLACILRTAFYRQVHILEIHYFSETVQIIAISTSDP